MANTENDLSFRIIGAAIEVHERLGPGLLESAYRDCLCRELMIRGLRYDRECLVQVNYKGVVVSGYRADIIVEDSIVLELKAVSRLDPIHSAQLLSYLRASGHSLGLLINFDVVNLKDGIIRLVNHFPEIS